METEKQYVLQSGVCLDPDDGEDIRDRLYLFVQTEYGGICGYSVRHADGCSLPALYHTVS